MKKYYLLFLIGISLLLVGCGSPKEKDPLDDFIGWYSSSCPTQVSLENSNFFKSSYEHKDTLINVTYSSEDEDIFTNEGLIYFHEDDMSVNVKMAFETSERKVEETYTINVKGVSQNEILQDCASKFEIKESHTNKYVTTYTLPARISYADLKIKCSWASDKPSIIGTNGIMNYPDAETDVNLTCTFSYEDESYNKTYTLKVLPLDETEFNVELNKIVLPTEIEENINLPLMINVDNTEYSITWSSNKQNVLKNSGELQFVSTNTSVVLTASITVVNKTISKTFNIIAKPISGMAAIEAIEKEIFIPTIISNDILLASNLNGVEITWASSNQDAISNNGVINKNNTTFKPVKLTATLKAGAATKTIEFDTQISYQSHMFIDRTFTGEKVNTTIENGKLVLEENKLNGTYTTNIIECNNFTECVGSYSAISSTTEICELKVRIRINNTWSKYFTYGEFGKGLKNGYSNQTDSSSKMVEDEIIVTSGNANAFQLQLTLKRSNAKETGPVVSLLALTIDYINHNYNVSIDDLPNEVKHDVPKLCQNVVPDIGGSICSITSSTMLLMYKGHSFDGLATYPHQYMAGILKDYGHNIYGNWSYNCIGMGSFGENAYVKRFYSYNEIMHHLYYVGPVAASIKGTFVTDSKTYNTGGHLIVLTGYKIENGNIYFYVNDPNNSQVSTRCTLQALKDVNRMVSYIVE